MRANCFSSSMAPAMPFPRSPIAAPVAKAMAVIFAMPAIMSPSGPKPLPPTDLAATPSCLMLPFSALICPEARSRAVAMNWMRLVLSAILTPGVGCGGLVAAEQSHQVKEDEVAPWVAEIFGLPAGVLVEEDGVRQRCVGRLQAAEGGEASDGGFSFVAGSAAAFPFGNASRAQTE